MSADIWPWWSVAPFVLLLAAIALMPLLAPHAWEQPRTQAWVSLALGGPVAAWAAYGDPMAARHALREYIAFICLVGSLALCASGINLRGSVRPSAEVNTALLAAGGMVASWVGTTGASMVCFPLLLRINAGRPRQAHLGVFFIFVVSNIGGLLTPLGDPPLFLGFMRGVPFTWTLRLAPIWALSLAYLLLVFWWLDRRAWAREPAVPVLAPAAASATGAPEAAAAATADGRLRLEGHASLALLLICVATVAAGGILAWPFGLAEGLMLATAGLAWRISPPSRRAFNSFTWAPLVEIGVLFAGIFAALMPATALVDAYGAPLGGASPILLFWATGLVSSFLDNAPTYLTLASCAATARDIDSDNLGQLARHASGGGALAAISLGAVMMGANTYLGNGPNLLVRGMAQARGVAMPHFFAYMGWSAVVLLPLFVAVGFSLS